MTKTKVRVWFISDPHFWHTSIIYYCKRPFKSVEEMNEQIISNWNRTIALEDTVIITGDFCFGSTEQLKEILKRLNGIKILVKGNHDKYNHTQAIGYGFAMSIDRLEMEIANEKVVVCHHPYRYSSMWKIFKRWIYRHKNHKLMQYPVDKGDWLIHGHTHDKEKQKGKMINVGVEAWDYMPVELSKIRDLICTRKNLKAKE